jgi:hypothetical protein
MCTGIGVEFSKWKHSFIEHDISRNVHPTRFNVKALVAFVTITIAKEDTLK